MELLDKQSVIFDIEASSKEEVIRVLVDCLDKQGSITSSQQFYQDVLAREQISPTAVGFDMGLPHGRTANVLRPAICFGRLNNAVIWNDKTSEIAKYVILIAVPIDDVDGTHLKVISSLARKLMHEEYREVLLNGSKDEVFQFLSETVKR